MNRRSTRVPSYRLHKASGQAVVTLAGKDHYLGKHGTPESKARFERLMAEYLGNGRRAPEPEGTPAFTVGELCLEFLEFAEREYRLPDNSMSREVANVRVALRPLVDLFLDLPAEEFGPMSLVLYRDRLIDEHALARKTMNQRVGIVRRAFKWAVRMERVPPTVLQGLQAVEGLKQGRSGARDAAPVRPVPDGDLRATLPLLPPLVRRMAELQLLTAARPGEIAVMRPCDIDMSGAIWIYRPPAHKNAWRGQAREIPIGPKGQDLIRPLLRPGYQEHYLFSPQRSEDWRREEQRANRKTPLWPSHEAAQERKRKANPARAPRECYDVQSYGRAIQRACSKAGVPHWSPGRLRHNAATDIRRQFGLEAASAILGHRLVETTQIYGDTRRELSLRIASEIG